MMWTLLHRRADGSFVVELNGHPYHVIESDTLFPSVAAAAEGVDLPPEPVPEPPPPQPVALTARQLRLGLLGLGVTGAQVDAAIAAIPDAMQREAAMIEWRHASRYHRGHPLIDSVAAALGISAAAIDAAWAHAATL
jgi:hypothetical protein